ncbi:PepSY-like domain-containing protein [Chryseolinea sp. H1M3-3]|uniref:PepSY-like domain-containing protein n=1 Tax=Chryseolinea sp. H1M3-3 TaxID=3034144 RepID=UPI0023EAF909|nr:PepSY-like domain-containing protein [Chryseolinea sp. H1M3-3]
MARNIIFIISFFLACSATAQNLNNDIPPLVKQSFERRFAHSDNVLWKALESHCFKAAFQIGKVLYSATFKDTGDWLEIDREIKKGYLPKPIRTTITKKFPGYRIDTAERIERIDGDTLYKVYLKKEFAVRIVQFSLAGDVIKIIQ